MFNNVAIYPLSDCLNIINATAEFLCSQAANSKVVLAACKDSLLQALGTLTCHEAGIDGLENCSLEHQTTLINSLMRPYQGKFSLLKGNIGNLSILTLRISIIV